MSLAKLEANRQNALKSTGPKTPEGRAISKMNALKHGIRSREVVVRGRVIKESGRAFTALHKRFTQKLQIVAMLTNACEERDEHHKRAALAVSVLPSASVLDKILRYQTALERQMFRAMNQLERLQRMRHGETILAPLTMGSLGKAPDGKKPFLPNEPKPNAP